MRINACFAVIFLALSLAACRTTTSVSVAEIEGTYAREDKPEISLVIHDGHFLQGGEEIHVEGGFTARKLSDGRYELNLLYTGRLNGARDRVLIRKAGDSVFLQDDGEGPETKFTRK